MLKKTSVYFLIIAAIATVFIHANAAKAQGIVEKGLVSYWPFNEGTIKGKIVSDLLGNNDGTLVGNPKIVDGKYGSALEFNGTSDYVDVPDDKSLQLWETYTLEAWIYQKESKSSRIIDKITAGTADGPHLDTHPGTTLRSCAGACISNKTQYSLKEWHHVAMTFDKGDVKFYLDGSPDGGGQAPSPLSGNSNPLRIGADSNGQNLFSGVIDEVRVYNRAINDAEIKQNMKSDGFAAINPAERLPITWGEIKRDISK
jgi:hypothetical protein